MFNYAFYQPLTFLRNTLKHIISESPVVDLENVCFLSVSPKKIVKKVLGLNFIYLVLSRDKDINYRDLST